MADEVGSAQQRGSFGESCERESSGKGEGIGRGREGACRGVAWWAPSASRGARRGMGSECDLATSRLSQSSECCTYIRYAISDCAWTLSKANTSYSVVDKYHGVVHIAGKSAFE